MRRNFGKLLIICFFIFNSSLIKSQVIDTVEVINDIKKKYGLIVSEKIENLKIETFNLADKYIVYHNEIDTFLIRRYIIEDEGGAYRSVVEEVLLWENEPFFYYEKSFTSWSENIEETRIYMTGNQVVKKLNKKTNVSLKEVFDKDLYQVGTGHVPNENVKISKRDIGHGESLVSYFKSELRKSKK